MGPNDSLPLRPDAAPDGAWDGMAGVVLHRGRPYGAGGGQSHDEVGRHGGHRRFSQHRAAKVRLEAGATLPFQRFNDLTLQRATHFVNALTYR